MDYHIEIDPKQFEQAVGDALARGAEGGLWRCGLKIESETRKRAPVDTGSLKSSITSKSHGEGLKMHVLVGPNVHAPGGAPYDIFQEFGTGLFSEQWGGGPFTTEGGAPTRHRIYPRTAKALAWRSRPGGWARVQTGNTRLTTKGHGDTVFAKSVAGVKPIHYMRDGIEAVDLTREFTTGFNSAR